MKDENGFYVTGAFLKSCQTSEKGTFTRKQIEALGMKYPPIAGWKGRLIGTMIPMHVAKYLLFLKGEKSACAKKYQRKLERLREATEKGEI